MRKYAILKPAMVQYQADGTNIEEGPSLRRLLPFLGRGSEADSIVAVEVDVVF